MLSAVQLHGPPADTPPSEGSVGIAIASCRRPALLERTLQSLAQQRLAAQTPELCVCVVDNDVAAEGLAVVQRLQADFPWQLSGVLEPRAGISFARNRGVLALAGCAWLAFIDDDEWAEPDWLAELLAMANRTGADAVLGPVVAEPSRPIPNWLTAAFDDESPLADGASVPPGRFRTGNLLLKQRWLADHAEPFHPDFALTGGSDSFLGEVLHRRGARFVYAARAIVHEHVPPERISLGRYLRRRFRCGMAYTRQQQLLEGSVVGRARGIYRGAGSVAVAPLSALASASRGPKALVPAAGLVAYGVGSLAATAGLRYSEYRTSKVTGDTG